MRRLLIVGLVLLALAAIVTYTFLTGLIVVIVENRGATNVATALVLNDKKIEPTKPLGPGETGYLFFVPSVESDVKLQCTDGHAETIFVEGYVGSLFVELITLQINGCDGVVSRTPYRVSP